MLRETMGYETMSAPIGITSMKKLGDTHGRHMEYAVSI
jgi:hypothetical protein